jgi:hypothetical protein
MLTVSEATNELLRLYRHDFLNILQVVGGLAQLNKTDRLLTYIRKASDEVQQFGRLISCGDPRLALILYEVLLQDISTGDYALYVKDTLPLINEEVLDDTQKILQALQSRLRSLGDCTLAVTLTGEVGPSVNIRLLCDEIQDSFWDEILQSAAGTRITAAANAEKSELTLTLG